MIQNYTTFKNMLKLKLFGVVAARNIVALGNKLLAKMIMALATRAPNDTNFQAVKNAQKLM
jgi:hypothetical protein